MDTIVGVDPGLNEVGLAFVDWETGRLVAADLVRVDHTDRRLKYVDAANQTVERLVQRNAEGILVRSLWVERPGIHGVRKKGKAIAGTRTEGGVTRNWTVIEDLIALSERVQAQASGYPAFVIPRKGADHWTLDSWCGRQSKEKRHMELTLATDAIEQNIARESCGRAQAKLHNVLDAWCIARWARAGISADLQEGDHGEL